jgi:hypothetical protein
MTGRIALITAEAASLVRQPASVLISSAADLGLVETIAAAPGEVMDALVEAYGDRPRRGHPDHTTRDSASSRTRPR